MKEQTELEKLRELLIRKDINWVNNLSHLAIYYMTLEAMEKDKNEKSIQTKHK